MTPPSVQRDSWLSATVAWIENHATLSLSLHIHDRDTTSLITSTSKTEYYTQHIVLHVWLSHVTQHVLSNKRHSGITHIWLGHSLWVGTGTKYVLDMIHSRYVRHDVSLCAMWFTPICIMNQISSEAANDVSKEHTDRQQRHYVFRVHISLLLHTYFILIPSHISCTHTHGYGVFGQSWAHRYVPSTLSTHNHPTV